MGVLVFFLCGHPDCQSCKASSTCVCPLSAWPPVTLGPPWVSPASLMGCILCRITCKAQEGTSWCLPMLQRVLGTTRGALWRKVCAAQRAQPGKRLPSQRSGWGSHAVKWLRQLKCAKLSWWQNTNLIFGMIPLSCRDHLLRSCLLLFCLAQEGDPRKLEQYPAFSYYKGLQLASPERGEGCLGLHTSAHWVH